MTRKTSILERKIYADPLTWGTPEMIREAKDRLKKGLPAAIPIFSDSAGGAAAAAAPSQTSAPSSQEKVEPDTRIHRQVPTGASPYPKIRAKYDQLIINVLEAKNLSKRDKRARIKNLEIRYESDIQEKRYQKYTLWMITGFIALAASIWYAKYFII